MFAWNISFRFVRLLLLRSPWLRNECQLGTHLLGVHAVFPGYLEANGRQKRLGSLPPLVLSPCKSGQGNHFMSDPQTSLALFSYQLRRFPDEPLKYGSEYFLSGPAVLTAPGS